MNFYQPPPGPPPCPPCPPPWPWCPPGPPPCPPWWPPGGGQQRKKNGKKIHSKGLQKCGWGGIRTVVLFSNCTCLLVLCQSSRATEACSKNETSSCFRERWFVYACMQRRSCKMWRCLSCGSRQTQLRLKLARDWTNCDCLDCERINPNEAIAFPCLGLLKGCEVSFSLQMKTSKHANYCLGESF